MSFTSGMRAADRQPATDIVEDIYTLSPLQQGMLFHILSRPAETLYFDQTVALLEGELDLRAFRRAWERVLERHAALRTAFQWEGLAKPVQVVYRHATLNLKVEDWRPLSENVRNARLEALLHEDRRRGFDLTRPPLFRLRLLQEGRERYRLIWSVSHLLVDAWCSTVVLEEVLRLYGAACKNEFLLLPPPVPYREYVAWLKGQDLGPAERFWRRYLEGLGEPLQLTGGGSGENADGGPGKGFRREVATIPAETTERLRLLARRWKLTLNTVVQGACAMAFSSLSRRWDFAVGVTLSGRSAPLKGVEGIVGPFVNTLPVRFRLSPEERAVRWLRRHQEQQLELRQHEHTPLQNVLCWSSRKESRDLFEAIFVFQNVESGERWEEAGLRVGERRFSGRPHYPLTITATPSRELTLEAAYDVSLFSLATVTSCLDRMRFFLNALSEREHWSIGRLVEESQREDLQLRRRRRERRRDSNSGRLKDTRPIPIPLSLEET